VEQVLAEIRSAKVTERGSSHADDRVNPAAMGRRKREGYL
jgi:sulfate adenylyltransferase subunit 2